MLTSPRQIPFEWNVIKRELFPKGKELTSTRRKQLHCLRRFISALAHHIRGFNPLFHDHRITSVILLYIGNNYKINGDQTNIHQIFQ